MTSVTHARSFERERAERIDVADRYLARVAALTPADWGRLDAAGEQLFADDPIAIWRYARLNASMLPALEGPLTVVNFGILVAFRAVAAIGGEEVLARLMPASEPDDAPRDAATERMSAQIGRLYEIARAQPGGCRDAIHVLTMGLSAIYTADPRNPDPFRRMYALVEPVIPAASL